MLLHFFIAFTVAAIYCLASRKLTFLADHWLVCGLFYGIAAFLVIEFGCLAAQRFALDWPLSASRTHSRPSRAHHHRRLTDLVRSSQLRETSVLDRRVGAGSFGEETGVNFIHCCLLSP
jgi:hypothetical protein